MISAPLRKIAADSNCLLSAVIGKAALKIFVKTDLEVVTTEHNLQEVKEYLPHLSQKYRLDLTALWLQLQMLPVSVFAQNHYKDHWSMAKKYLKDRDSDDIHLGALAFKEQIPIWSNDRDFLILPVEVYTTEQLLKKFNI